MWAKKMEKMERPRALILWQYSLIHWFSHNIYAKTSGYHLYTQTVRSSVDFLMSECLKIFLQTPMKEGLKIFVFNPKAGNFFPIRISTKICFFIYVNLIFCISIHSLIFDNVMHKLLRSRRGSSNGKKKYSTTRWTLEKWVNLPEVQLGLLHSWRKCYRMWNGSSMVWDSQNWVHDKLPDYYRLEVEKFE